MSPARLPGTKTIQPIERCAFRSIARPACVLLACIRELCPSAVAKNKFRFVLVVLWACVPAFAQSASEVNIDLSQLGTPLAINHFALGQGGLSSDPMWADRMPEVRAVQPRIVRLFIQEYFDVMPEKGKYDWHKLDDAVSLIIQTGASPLMSIDIKPAALFPTVDESVTDPSDYGAWEALISAMVSHYKSRGQSIAFWEVANEPDIGENGGCPYKFTPEGYVRYYEHTVAAIRKADPDAKVGGPALANPESPILPALLKACQSRNIPLDFVSWHIYNSDPLAIRATIDRKKELLKKFPSLHPETILDEWNMSLSNPVTDPRFQPAFIAETAWQMKDAGLDYSCYYHIRDYHVDPAVFAKIMSARGTAGMTAWWNRMAQYDGLFDFQNHVRPAYFVFRLLSRLTGQRVALTSSDPQVHGFAAFDPFFDSWNIMLWNFSEQPRHVNLKFHGLTGTLRMHELELDALAPSDDENLRLRPMPAESLSPSSEVGVNLKPWDVLFWSLGKR